jgi:hypothetical protein
MTCRWFALCTNEAVALVRTMFAPEGVPVCQRCIDKLGLTVEEARA